MENRKAILQQKAERFRQRIQSWAKKEGLLKDGEQIEVSVQISGPKELLQMSLEDLFTVERLQAFGCGKHLIGHIRHNLVGLSLNTHSPYLNRPFATVGDIVQLGKSGLKGHRRIGPNVLATIEKVFESIGLKLEN